VDQVFGQRIITYNPARTRLLYLVAACGSVSKGTCSVEASTALTRNSAWRALEIVLRWGESPDVPLRSGGQFTSR